MIRFGADAIFHGSSGLSLYSTLLCSGGAYYLSTLLYPAHGSCWAALVLSLCCAVLCPCPVAQA